MYDDEPRALCNIPLSGTVGILSSLVLLSQVLALFLVCSNNFFIYFFELIIAFGMVFFLSQGVRHRKPGHLTVYLAYLAIYVFMMFFIIFGILVGISFYPSYKRECERRSAATTSITPTATTASDLSSTSSAETVTVHPNRIYVAVIPSRSDTNCEPIHGAFWAEIWSSIALCFLSIIIACIQIRYTLLLYKFMRLHQREIFIIVSKKSSVSTLNEKCQHIASSIWRTVIRTSAFLSVPMPGLFGVQNICQGNRIYTVV
ncbi:hypothetical protein RB195_004244 [Necator americanus]|uniref:G protein-coupled receptor n=1 Tax=Necator americanus TaxID=51031 RepID=A0ABR1BJ26_NECAM